MITCHNQKGIFNHLVLQDASKFQTKGSGILSLRRYELFTNEDFPKMGTQGFPKYDFPKSIFP